MPSSLSPLNHAQQPAPCRQQIYQPSHTSPACSHSRPAPCRQQIYQPSHTSPAWSHSRPCHIARAMQAWSHSQAATNCHYTDPRSSHQPSSHQLAKQPPTVTIRTREAATSQAATNCHYTDPRSFFRDALLWQAWSHSQAARDSVQLAQRELLGDLLPWRNTGTCQGL